MHLYYQFFFSKKEVFSFNSSRDLASIPKMIKNTENTQKVPEETKSVRKLRKLIEETESDRK